MSARTKACVRVRVTTYEWVEVQAVTLDDALDEARAEGREPELAQWDKREEE